MSTESKGVETLGPAHYQLLRELAGLTGVDVWGRPDAVLCRDLEKVGFVRIVKPRNAPEKGEMRQPYFGVKIKAAGRAALPSPSSGEGG